MKIPDKAHRPKDPRVAIKTIRIRGYNRKYYGYTKHSLEKQVARLLFRFTGDQIVEAVNRVSRMGSIQVYKLAEFGVK